jgi:hypothetical protein
LEEDVMARELEQETEQWLAAEAAGDAAAAEAALGRAFQHLPTSPVPTGFTDRVMARVALEFRPDPFSTRRVRAAIAAAFLAAASLMLVSGLILRANFGEGRPLDLLETLSQAAATCGRWLPATLQVAEGLATDLVTLSGVTARLLTTPPALFAIIGLTLLCAGAFRLLQQLSQPRGTSHVDAV